MKKIIFLLSMILITLSGFSQKIVTHDKVTTPLIKIPSGVIPNPSTNFLFAVSGHLYWGTFRLDSIYVGVVAGLQSKTDTNRTTGYDATMFYVDSLLMNYIPKVLANNPGNKDTIVFFDNGQFYLSSFTGGGQQYGDTLRNGGYDATFFYVDSIFYAGLLAKLNVADSSGNAPGNYVPHQQLTDALLTVVNIADSSGNAPGNYVPHQQLTDALLSLVNIADSSGNAPGNYVPHQQLTDALFLKRDLNDHDSLTQLNDVVVSAPVVNQVIAWNGSEWVNSNPASSSASNGVDFYPDDVTITAAGVNNTYPIKTLSRTPVTTTEDVDQIVLTNNSVMYGTYFYNLGLGSTSIEAGIWEFDIYCGVSSATNVTSLSQNVYRARPETGTVTITGAGTSRTCTASSGTPFATDKIDATASVLTCSFVQTPLGIYPITARTSDVEVTITVPTTYTNESGVALHVHKRLFGVNTGELNNVAGAGPGYTGLILVSVNSVQPAYTIESTDKLASSFIGTSDGNRTVYFAHNGTSRYSHFHSPLTTRHNDLAGLNGGSGDERYHMTAAQHTIATQAGSTSVAGYLTTTNFDLFNAKAPTANPTFTGTIGGVDMDLTGNIDADSTISAGFIALGNCGAAITVYLRRGNTQTITRNASTTVTLQGGVPGTTYTLVFIHEASTTAYTVAFSPVPKWVGGTSPTYTNTSGAYDAVTVKCIGSGIYLGYSGADFK